MRVLFDFFINIARWACKGIEKFDYLVATQQDTLIDKDRLAEGFLKMHEKLGLLLDEEEQQTNASH